MGRPYFDVSCEYSKGFNGFHDNVRFKLTALAGDLSS